MEQGTPIRIFVSYAHEDEPYRAELAKQLDVLKRLRKLEYWDDRELTPGCDWENEITGQLERADIIVLLISTDFLRSGFIETHEMTRALDRHAAKSAVVIPVLVRATITQWKDIRGLGRLQAIPIKRGTVPSELVPVNEWEHSEEAWNNVSDGLCRAIDEFRRRHPLPPAQETPRQEPSSASVANDSIVGFQALIKLMASPAIRTRVEKFRDHLALASQQILILGDLKDLHDALHGLHFEYYAFAAQESRRPDPDVVNWASLDQADKSLPHLIRPIEEVVTRGTLPEPDVAWVRELSTARDEFHSAVQACDLSCLRRAIQLIRKILAFQPVKINVRLTDTVQTLPLPSLAAEMEEVRKQLKGELLASPEGQRFTKGVSALKQLSSRLPSLAQEHSQWQEIDAEMQRIEAQLGHDLTDLELSWENLKASLIKIGASSEEPWAQVLRDEVEKLDTALASDIPVRIEHQFRSCYSQAGTRFFNVDLKLKQLCGELRKVGAELNEVLKEL